MIFPMSEFVRGQFDSAACVLEDLFAHLIVSLDALVLVHFQTAEHDRNEPEL